MKIAVINETSAADKNADILATLLKLESISTLTHRPFAEIIEMLPDDVVMPALEYPGMKELIEVDSIEELALKEAFQKRIGEVDIIEVS